jgi:hypothetical protein
MRLEQWSYSRFLIDRGASAFWNSLLEEKAEKFGEAKQ